MCYGVILIRFCTQDCSIILIGRVIRILQNNAIPVFMFISFFISGKKFWIEKIDIYEKKLSDYTSRFFFWNCVYSIIFYLCSRVGLIEEQIKLKDIVWQFLSGHSTKINSTLCFFVILLIYWIICGCLVRIVDNNKKTILFFAVLSGISICLSVSINGQKMYLEQLGEIGVIGYRFIFYMPYAFGGITLSNISIFESICRRRKVWFLNTVVCIVLQIMLMHYSNPVLMFATVVSTVVLFYGINLDGISNLQEKCFFAFTKYTLGIYCLHNLVGRVLKIFILKCRGDIRTDFLFCLSIYIICYFVSSMIGLIGCKLKIETIRNLVD